MILKNWHNTFLPFFGLLETSHFNSSIPMETRSHPNNIYKEHLPLKKDSRMTSKKKIELEDFCHLFLNKDNALR